MPVRLAVAGNTGDADNLAFAHLERHILNPGHTLAVAPRHVLHIEYDLARMGRGRGIVDFVSSLTDAQAVAYAARLGGASGLLWVNSGL